MEAFLKAFLTVEIVVVFSDLFFHLFVKQMLKGVHWSSANIWSSALEWELAAFCDLFFFPFSLLFCF